MITMQLTQDARITIWKGKGVVKMDINCSECIGERDGYGNCPIHHEIMERNMTKKEIKANAVWIVEGCCGYENTTEEEQIAAWQHLHTSGLAYILQGWFSRQATELIKAGVITA